MAISANSIVHYTDTIEKVKGILKDGFRTKYCWEKILTKDGKQMKGGFPMICFCDIPLGDVKNHMDSYGYYGVGLTKKWATLKGLNPVFYIDKESSLSNVLREQYDRYRNAENKDVHKDWYSDFVLTISHTKNYEAPLLRGRVNDEKYRFYNEREWRFVPGKEQLRGTKRVLATDEYSTNREEYNEKVKNIVLPFDVSDKQKPFVNKIRPKTPTEDYQLDREKVLDIISLISNQCLQFEKTPKTYHQFEETNLRDLLLSNLNSIFEGKATGETFNNKGKTDIYLNIDKGNILIAECKYYGGKKVYHETIDQILGYLTWRQNYGIIINFCKQKNFSKVLEEGEAIIKGHASYDSNFKTQTTSHLISKHTLPSDEYKYVEIHHLYYNLYTP